MLRAFVSELINFESGHLEGNGWQTSWKHVYDRLMESVAIMRNHPTQEQMAEALRLLGDAVSLGVDRTAPRVHQG